MHRAILILLLFTSLASADEGSYVTVAPVPTLEQPSNPPTPQQPGTPVYPADACIGSVVAGVCHGAIQSTDPAPQRCYGQILNGQCTGPQF